MIFLTLGSQNFQFNRLLLWIDEICADSDQSIDIRAQIGNSSYIPKNYEFERYFDRNQYAHNMQESDLIITHGGTGAIISALKYQKKVIAVPRLKIFGEHVDDHQIEITKNFSDKNLIFCANNKIELHEKIKTIESHIFSEFVSNNHTYLNFLLKKIKEN